MQARACLGGGGVRCLECDDSHFYMRAMNYNVTRAFFTGPLCHMHRQYLTLHTEYMEGPRFKGDIDIHNGLYIHSHIVYFRSQAQFWPLALFN